MEAGEAAVFIFLKRFLLWGLVLLSFSVQFLLSTTSALIPNLTTVTELFKRVADRGINFAVMLAVGEKGME